MNGLAIERYSLTSSPGFAAGIVAKVIIKVNDEGKEIKPGRGSAGPINGTTPAGPAQSLSAAGMETAIVPR
ncbi:MAG: hypothetical protein NPIRA06_24780 [Nitrospirales bacterium]|nr:MAG: hypothetical protein NPIRA06_24780 [Nitrospirales bacterium]